MHTMSSRVRRSVGVACLALLPLVFACFSIASEGVKLKVVASVSIDESMGRFNQPSGLFYDENKQRLYIADSANKRIVSLDSEFRYLAALSKKEIVLPVGIVRDSKGVFYVVDAERGEVLLIDVKKDRVEPLLLTGVPPGADFFVPGRIAIDKKDHLYIIDKLNKRVVIVNTAGAFIRSVTVKGEDFSGFTDVRVDDEGYLYALDTVSRTVYVFNGKGSVVSSFGGKEKGLFLFPVSLAVGNNGLLYVLDRHAGKIMVFNRAGGFQHAISRKGANDGELATPSYLWIDNSNTISIVDGDRIQVFKEVEE